MAVLFDSPFFTALDATGVTISGAKLKFYLAGTSTPTNAYADRGLSTSLGATVTADSAGRFPDIWLSDAIDYKVQYTDAADVPIKTVDYAVQATSATPASDSSATEWKSPVINGGFDNWTSGTSFSNISGSNAEVAIVDGWRFWQPGSASNAVSRQAAASNPARYGLRFGRPASSVSTQSLRTGSLLPPELVYRLRGKKVVLSLVMQAGANFSAASVSLTLATGTGTAEALAGISAGTWTGQAAPISAAQAITTTATRYAFTATLDSNITEAGLVVSYSPTGTAGANDWVQVENVQLEVGDSATDFSARPAVLDFMQAWDNSVSRAVLQASTVSAVRTVLGINVADNRLINPRMEIDQRNAGAAVTVNSTTATYAVDRWFGVGQAADGVFTLQQQTGGPAGFSHFLRATVTTADASIGASQSYYFGQRIEGRMISDLDFGLSSAQTVTLRFLARSSVAGAFSGALRNGAGNRSYPISFTINAINTWELKSVTLTGDVTGTWATDSTTGLELVVDLGAGTSVRGTANAWAASGLVGVTGAVSLMSTLSATLDIAGAELVKAGSDLGPSWRPYGQELDLCKRYFQRIGGLALFHHFGFGQVRAATVVEVTAPFSPELRGTPTLAVGSATGFIVSDGAVSPTSTAVALSGGANTTRQAACVAVTAAGGGMTVGRAARVDANNTLLGRMDFSAEL